MTPHKNVELLGKRLILAVPERLDFDEGGDNIHDVDGAVQKEPHVRRVYTSGNFQHGLLHAMPMKMMGSASVLNRETDAGDSGLGQVAEAVPTEPETYYESVPDVYGVDLLKINNRVYGGQGPALLFSERLREIQTPLDFFNRHLFPEYSCPCDLTLKRTEVPHKKSTRRIAKQSAFFEI